MSSKVWKSVILERKWQFQTHSHSNLKFFLRFVIHCHSTATPLQFHCHPTVTPLPSHCHSTAIPLPKNIQKLQFGKILRCNHDFGTIQLVLGHFSLKITKSSKISTISMVFRQNRIEIDENVPKLIEIPRIDSICAKYQWILAKYSEIQWFVAK